MKESKAERAMNRLTRHLLRRVGVHVVEFLHVVGREPADLILAALAAPPPVGALLHDRHDGALHQRNLVVTHRVVLEFHCNKKRKGRHSGLK